MNNLIQNYKIILKELTKTCHHIKTSKQIRIPKLSDLELVALNITAEYMSINSELQLFRVISGTELENKIERSIYNKRKRRLVFYIEKIRQTLSEKFSDFTDVFIVDSTPIEICKISRANRSQICSTDEIQPAFGYCAAQKSRYFGYKLHAVCDKNGIFHSYDFSPANIHDVNYLNDIKHDFENCLLIGDRGYISKNVQLDLFETANIRLEVPYRLNQKDWSPTFIPFAKARKRIETDFSQLCDQFMIVRNYAKDTVGLFTRILGKISAFTILQYINHINNKPIGRLKYALI